MIDHTGIVVKDLEQSKKFYKSVLAAIGHELLMEVTASDTGLAYAAGFGQDGRPEFWIKQGMPSHPPTHIAFRVNDRRLVEEFHRTALVAGGRDNGGPGLRPHYHAEYYGAYILDFDGYNVEAVCHEPTLDK